MKVNNRYLIETANGYKNFLGVRESRNTGLIITHNMGVIKCTTEHQIMVGENFFKRAAELTVGDIIDGSVITKITPDASTKLYYDPIEVLGGNAYISEGVTHHNCLVVDECAFIKTHKWDEFSESIFPTQASLAFKKNIIISTANGMNHFYHMVKGARENSNGYKSFEVDWKEIPRYKSDGSVQKPDEFQSAVVEKHGIIHFNSNYANQFIGSSHTLISANKLAEMQHQDIEELRDGKLKIFKYPVSTHRYIMSIDAAKDGTDAFAVQIVDITDFRFEQVAAAALQVDYLLMPEFINEWCEFYNNPYLIIENNEGAGQSVADIMYQTYEYENLHFDKDVGRNKRKRYPGFRTTVKTRKQILQTLKLFIENDKLIISDKSTINEFLQFILINNKFQADEGAHDDMIMSLGMIFVPFCNTKNFEDMKVLISQLYNSDDLAESEKVNFGELLTIGSFDSGTDEDYLDDMKTKEHLTIEDALIDYDGFT